MVAVVTAVEEDGDGLGSSCGQEKSEHATADTATHRSRKAVHAEHTQRTVFLLLITETGEGDKKHESSKLFCALAGWLLLHMFVA